MRPVDQRVASRFECLIAHLEVPLLVQTISDSEIPKKLKAITLIWMMASGSRESFG
jgi:hypothetical protein